MRFLRLFVAIFSMSTLNGRILITGGAGFIGSTLVWALNQRGITDILVVDVLRSDEKWKNLVPLRFRDYLDHEEFEQKIESSPKAFGKISAVFHLGGCSSTTETDASYILKTNYELTKTLARWSIETESRFIYASSAATYGDGSQGMDDKDENLHRLRPLNMYGYSKHLFDIYAQREGWLSRIVGVKYFNVFGPNEDHKVNVYSPNKDHMGGDMRSLVNKAYQQILATGRVQLFKSHKPEFKDGEQMRDFLYVKDAVEMTIHFAEHPQGSRAGGLYNLGSGQANTWLALTRAIFAALGRPPQIEFIEMPDVLRGKYQYFTEANVTKLRATGYDRKMTPLPDAVKDYVQGHLVPGKKLGE